MIYEEPYQPPEPDDERWEGWKQRHPGKVPGSAVRVGKAVGYDCQVRAWKD